MIHCIYGLKVEATEQCAMCDKPLCSACGYVWDGEVHCNECYALVTETEREAMLQEEQQRKWENI